MFFLEIFMNFLVTPRRLAPPGVVLVAALAALAVLRVPEKALIALGGGAGCVCFVSFFR